MKILVVCKELYTYPMNFVCEELRSQGHDVAVVFIHYTESILRNFSYTSFCDRNPDTSIFTFDKEIECYWDHHRVASQLLDREYLLEIEKKYCNNISFGELLMSSQMFTTQYHARTYFRDLSEEEMLYWVQLVFKKIETMLELFKPDRIVDIDNSEFGRSALHLVAKKEEILYVTLESSRYKSIWLPTYELGRTTDQYFEDYFYQTNAKNSTKGKFIEEVDEFRNLESIMLKDYEYNSTSKVIGETLFSDLTKFASIIKSLFIQWKGARQRFHIFKRKPLIASLWDACYFFLLGLLRQRYIFSSYFSYFKEPNKSDKYVYFPLHLIPESTTLIKSPLYPNEMTVIEALSKSLPLGWKIYIKEHGAMVGERPIAFYRYVSRFSNIRLVKMDYYNDPKPWILNSIGVVTLSGSSAFEAAMLGKRSLIFGNTFFEHIDGVDKIESFSDLPSKIRQMSRDPIENRLSCAAYLQSISKFGKYIPLIQLLAETRIAVQKESKLSNEMAQVLKDLVSILLEDFRKA
jgi:hypothetical protein